MFFTILFLVLNNIEYIGKLVSSCVRSSLKIDCECFEFQIYSRWLNLWSILRNFTSDDLSKEISVSCYFFPSICYRILHCARIGFRVPLLQWDKRWKLHSTRVKLLIRKRGASTTRLQSTVKSARLIKIFNSTIPISRCNLHCLRVWNGLVDDSLATQSPRLIDFATDENRKTITRA